MPAKTVVRPDWNWQRDALCRGEDLVLFFGPDGERQPERDRREAKAKALCAQCPALTACRDYSLTRPEKYSTWGNLNEEERASERRRQMRGAANQAARARQEEEREQERLAEEARRAASRRVSPSFDPERDLELLRQSEALQAAGESLTDAARVLKMARSTLTGARRRARKRLAEVAS